MRNHVQFLAISTWLALAGALALASEVKTKEAAPMTVPEPFAPAPVAAGKPALVRETVALTDADPSITLQLVFRPKTVERHPVILMLGSIAPEGPPEWSAGLVDEGYMLAAFAAKYPPDPDPERRPVFLRFDQAFANSYVLGGHRAPRDAGRVIDYLIARGDVHPQKIGWLGGSSTGIPGLAVATREHRLAAIVAFVSTGAYSQWLLSWKTNGLWVGKTPDLWPETLELLKTDDPILHVDTMYPTAVLMVSGGADKVVDPATARAFADAARPFYEKDPDRLRLVIYEGFTHNLPRDVVRMYAENWFHLYMDPLREPPASEEPARDLKESVIRTQINAAQHQDLMGAKEPTK